MSSFQIIGLCLLAFLMILTLRGRAKKRIGVWGGFFWIGLWLASAAALARPELTILVAQTLGIGRGSDLVFYTAILAGGIGFFFVFLRLRRIEEQLTVLVRHIALHETAEDTENEPPRSLSTGHSPKEGSGTSLTGS